MKPFFVGHLNIFVYHICMSNVCIHVRTQGFNKDEIS